MRCKDQHIWLATFVNVHSGGSWCKTCAGLDKYTIEDCKKAAIEKGGLCLSDVCKGAHDILTWQCDKNQEHVWYTSIKHIVDGSWCPRCRNKNESTCRDIFEKLFNKTFSSTRDIFTERRLELDGYNADLKLAFEYQGQQHYHVVDIFHKNGEEDLKKQQERDAEKKKLCKKYGITLIEIPYTVKNDYKESYIINELRKVGLWN